MRFMQSVANGVRRIHPRLGRNARRELSYSQSTPKANAESGNAFGKAESDLLTEARQFNSDPSPLGAVFNLLGQLLDLLRLLDYRDGHGGCTVGHFHLFPKRECQGV